MTKLKCWKKDNKNNQRQISWFGAKSNFITMTNRFQNINKEDRWAVYAEDDFGSSTMKIPGMLKKIEAKKIVKKYMKNISNGC